MIRFGLEPCRGLGLAFLWGARDREWEGECGDGTGRWDGRI